MKTSLEIKKIRKKIQNYRSRKKDKKTQEYLREKALTEKWQERKKKYDAAYILELQQKERLQNERRELVAKSLEQKAEEIRSQSVATRNTNIRYLDVSKRMEKSDAGTLNLPSFCPLSSNSPPSELKNAIQGATFYRDAAEDLKKENRKLRVEMSEKIEAVRRFWRNCILEEKSDAGKMVMHAIRSSN